MDLLLDTHVFLWAVARSRKLRKAARNAIEDPANALFLSSAAAWEIAVKYCLGKLPLPSPPAVYVPARTRDLGCSDLPVLQQHTVSISELPNHHADPFDRIMIAQAQIEGLTFVTADPLVLQYPIQTLDAR